MKSKLEKIKIENCNEAQLYKNLHKDPINTIILTAKTIIAEYKDDHFNCNQSSNLNPKCSNLESKQIRKSKKTLNRK